MRKHWKLVLAFFFTFMIGNFCGWLVHDSSETAPATALPPTSVASPTQTPTPVVATATAVPSTAAATEELLIVPMPADYCPERVQKTVKKNSNGSVTRSWVLNGCEWEKGHLMVSKREGYSYKLTVIDRYGGRSEEREIPSSVDFVSCNGPISESGCLGGPYQFPEFFYYYGKLAELCPEKAYYFHTGAINRVARVNSETALERSVVIEDLKGFLSKLAQDVAGKTLQACE